MLEFATTKLLVLPAVLLLALSTLTCEEVKPSLVTQYVFGDCLGRGTLSVAANSYQARLCQVTPSMLEWGDKRVTIVMRIWSDEDLPTDFYIFDANQYLIFQGGLPATPLNSTRNATSCDMWANVADEGDYYAVIKNQADFGTTFTGYIYMTYWKVE